MFSSAGNHLGKVDSLGWRDDLGDHKRGHGKLLADVQCGEVIKSHVDGRPRWRNRLLNSALESRSADVSVRSARPRRAADQASG